MSSKDDVIPILTAEYFSSLHEKLSAVAKEKNRYERHINTDNPEIKLELAKQLASGTVEFDFSIDMTDEEKSIYTASMIFWLLGMEDMADKMSAAAIKYLVMRINMGQYVKKISSVATSHQARENASKPRVPFKDEAINIIRATWKIHPYGSPADMKRKVADYFRAQGGKEDTVGRWIKEHGLQPVWLGKYKAFPLVIPHKK